MAYNLATAALATEVNKSTILRAIKAGCCPQRRNRLDHRGCGATSCLRAFTGGRNRRATGDATGSNHRCARLLAARAVG